MRLGYRIFIVQGEDISRLSQRDFNRFYFRLEPVLEVFSGREIDIATVIYSLDGRKPKEVLRIDLQRCKVKPDGSIDEDHQFEGGRLIANRIDLSFANSKPAKSTRVVEAQDRFDERRLAARHCPELSGVVRRKILNALFS